jgi:hypothetical protein
MLLVRCALHKPMPHSSRLLVGLASSPLISCLTRACPCLPRPPQVPPSGGACMASPSSSVSPEPAHVSPALSHPCLTRTPMQVPPSGGAFRRVAVQAGEQQFTVHGGKGGGCMGVCVLVVVDQPPSVRRGVRESCVHASAARVSPAARPCLIHMQSRYQPVGEYLERVPPPTLTSPHKHTSHPRLTRCAASHCLTHSSCTCRRGTSPSGNTCRGWHGRLSGGSGTSGSSSRPNQ